jgi:diadenosine tetraphosphate (Ap4A) HIT family hydrolase
MDNSRWERFARGEGCPLDAPRPLSNDHWDFVVALSVSSLYLSKNQTYRGHCQLIFDPRHVARVDQLSAVEWNALSADLFKAQAAIMRTVGADHLNVESLGNVVPHVHWHIVPRYRGDLRCGSPIWVTSLDDMIDTRLPAEEQQALVEQLKAACGVRSADL